MWHWLGSGLREKLEEHRRMFAEEAVGDGIKESKQKW